MQIQINTDNHIRGGSNLTANAQAVIQDALARFGDRITRVEVHFTDENSRDKTGDRDKRCVMEARLAGHQPITVSHDDASLDQALDGATEKLVRSLTRTLDRLYDPKGRTSFAGDQSLE